MAQGKRKHRNRTRRQARRVLNALAGAVVSMGRRTHRLGWGAGLTRGMLGKGHADE